MTEEKRYLNYLQNFITQERIEKFEKVIENRTNHFTVAVEDLFQMHNTSAVIRSCDAFGLQNIHIIEKKFSKKIDRNISMGSQKWVNENRYKSSVECIEKLKEEGYQIVATSPENNSVELDEFDIEKKSAFFFGTERKGLTDEVFQRADSTLKIPMVGFCQSLNISVCVAIILQNITHRLRESNIDWRLGDLEKINTKIKWTITSIKEVDYVIERYRKNNNL